MALQALGVVEHRAVPLEDAEALANGLAEAVGRDHAYLALRPAQETAERGDSANHAVVNFRFPILAVFE